MKKILYPTDFSKNAEKAFIYALNMANQLNASVTTLHTYEKPDVGDFVMPFSLKEFYEGLDLDEFENYRSALPAMTRIAEENGFSHISLNHAMVEGKTIESILKTAADEQYDLIVMFTEGASLLKEIFIGTVAGEVMENAPCPVMVIPEKAIFDGSINRLAATIDFAEDCKPFINQVLDFADLLQANTYCLHVDNTHTQSITHQFDAFKASYTDNPNVFFENIDSSDVVDALAHYCEAHQIDLLVMKTHKRSFLEELFSFSHAKKMTYHHKTPVLVFQSERLEKA